MSQTLLSPSSQLPVSVDASGHFSFHPEERWTQGRTLFGGLVTAAALRGLRLFLNDDSLVIRTVTTRFEKPVRAAPVTGRCTVSHQGKRVVSADVEVIQDDVVRTRVHVLFGRVRESKIAVPAPVAAPTPAPDTLEEMPYFEGLAPTFTQFVDFRWAKGEYPFTAADTSDFQGYCRWKERGDHIQEEQLALLDAWPAPVLCMADGPIPASSITWTAHLFPLADDVDPSGHYWFDAKTLRAEDGYATSIAHLHDANGRLVAWGEQLVAYFD